MVKLRVKPGRMLASEAPSRRSRRTQKEWKVETMRFEREYLPAAASRSAFRISSAALLVKVTATMAEAGLAGVDQVAMRCVITLVLPLPAPAKMSSGPPW